MASLPRLRGERHHLRPARREQISGLSVPLPLPAGFDGLDAGDGQIAVRIHDPDGYRLIEIDPATGEQRTLLSGVEHLSLPAVAASNAAVLRRDGDHEQLLLVPLTGDGAPRVLASRVGARRWGAGEIAEGRPVAYDGTRVVFTARRDSTHALGPFLGASSLPDRFGRQVERGRLAEEERDPRPRRLGTCGSIGNF